MRRMGRMPRIAPKIARDDFIGEMAAQCAEARDIEQKMRRLIGLEILQREMKEAHGGAEPATVLGMIGSQKLLLQMHKRASCLDQAFEKEMVFVLVLQPEMLENVVRFVILPRIEAAKEALVARVQLAAGVGAEFLHEAADAVAFFHPA